ncbi:MAG: RNA 2',3'-cyclic phosphodiesterase [Parcubacteria group bacterium]|nr:MAG: RNA 2',3'-cyclic phosphodiesterase [Parcubacteria group bacterium]
MNTYRLFIDLPVDPAFSHSLFKHFDRLNLPWSKLKKVEARDMHLTLKFLGETPLERLEPIINALSDIKLNFREIELISAGPKIFTENNPRILALALKPNEKLSALFLEIDQSLAEAGLAARDNRGYTPHLTLARVKEAARPEEFEAFLNWSEQLGGWVSGYFELQESQLTPRGPKYDVMQTFDL